MAALRRLWVGFFILAIGIGIGGLVWAQEGPKEAISFALNDVSGKPVSMDDYFGKQPVLISFFATWCPACNEEVPLLEAVNKEYGRQMAIFAIDIKEGPKKVSSFIKRNKISYKVLLDANGEVAQRYLVRGIPTIVLIDSAGALLYYGHDLNEAKKRFPVSADLPPPAALGSKGVLKYAASEDERGKEALCPVMGEKFTVKKESPAAKYKGNIYYFCCSSCLNKFAEDPEKYISTAKK